jgi:hypothetical protein
MISIRGRFGTSLLQNTFENYLSNSMNKMLVTCSGVIDGGRALFTVAENHGDKALVAILRQQPALCRFN